MDFNYKELKHPERTDLRYKPCPECFSPMGDMPGSRDAYCKNCGFKDPCCGD